MLVSLLSRGVVISAVGATGSGTLTLFLPLLLEAASHAGISRLRIDTIILHPTTSMDDERLLANAEALYAELAATPLYDIQKRAIRYTYSGHGDPVTSVAYTADGRYVLSVAGKQVHLWKAV